MERLCSRFGVDFHYSGSHAPRENNQSMVSCDWAAQHIHECIVGWPCRCCPARNLGLHAIKLMAGKRRGEDMFQPCVGLICLSLRSANLPPRRLIICASARPSTALSDAGRLSSRSRAPVYAAKCYDETPRPQKGMAGSDRAPLGQIRRN